MPYLTASSIELHGRESGLRHALTGAGPASTCRRLHALLTRKQVPSLGAGMGVYPAPRPRWDDGYPGLDGVCFHRPDLQRADLGYQLAAPGTSVIRCNCEDPMPSLSSGNDTGGSRRGFCRRPGGKSDEIPEERPLGQLVERPLSQDNAAKRSRLLVRGGLPAFDMLQGGVVGLCPGPVCRAGPYGQESRHYSYDSQHSDLLVAKA